MVLAKIVNVISFFALEHIFHENHCKYDVIIIVISCIRVIFFVFYVFFRKLAFFCIFHKTVKFSHLGLIEKYDSTIRGKPIGPGKPNFGEHFSPNDRVKIARAHPIRQTAPTRATR